MGLSSPARDARRGLGLWAPGRRVRAGHVGLLLAVALGLLLRVYRIGSQGLWMDEAFSVWLARQPLVEMVRLVVTVDQHPPLYYALLRGWIGVFGSGEAGVRALSALFGTLTIPVVYLLGWRLADERVGLVGALILSVSPFHVRFSQEARMYTLLTLSASLALYAFVRLVERWHEGVDRGRAGRRLDGVGGRGPADADRCGVSDPGRSRDPGDHAGEPGGDVLPWIGYVIFTAGAVWTHNAAVLLPLALNLFVVSGVLIRRRRGAIGGAGWGAAAWPRRWILAQAAIVVLWLPWAPSFISQAVGVYRRFWLPPPTPATVLSVVSVLLCDFVPLPAAGIVAVDGGLITLALLGPGGLRRPWVYGTLLGVMFVVPLVAEWVLSAWRPILYDRTLIWTSIPLVLLVGAGVCQVRRLLSSRTAHVVALVAVLAVNGGALVNYFTNFQKEEWDDAAALVAEQVQPDDLILFSDAWGQIPFEYYFRELYNRPVAAHGAPVDLFDRGVLEPEMTEEDVPRLRALSRGHERVWLVYSRDWYTDPNGLVRSTLDREMAVVRRWEFRGLSVLLYGR